MLYKRFNPVHFSCQIILKYFMWLSVFMVVSTCVYSPCQASWVWDLSPAIPDDDQDWQVFEKKWDQHWDGKNIDELLQIAVELEKKYPDKIETKLWLGRIYFLKAQFKKKNNLFIFKEIEKLAVQAHKLDKNNVFAFKMLIEVLPYVGDLEYSMEQHGDWIKSQGPLHSGYVVPPLTGNEEWEKTLSLWNSRAGQEFDTITQQGLDAVDRFNRLAEKNPDHIETLAWACRANYDIGQYYTSLGFHEEKALKYYRKAIYFGKKALCINKYYMPAVYWTLISRARLIQEENLFTKAKNVSYLMENGLLGLRENGLYNYYGPSLALSTMITNGGWVAEKGIRMAGISVDVLINQLRLAQVVYPNKLYALYGLADIYAHQGENEEALKVLDVLFSKDPDKDPYIKLENRSVVRFARKLKQEIENKRG